MITGQGVIHRDAAGVERCPERRAGGGGGRLDPVRALDVGCGEGADAVWLSARGWEVTALNVSQVALDRASAAARAAGIQVHWLLTGQGTPLRCRSRQPAGNGDRADGVDVTPSAGHLVLYHDLQIHTSEPKDATQAK